MNKQLEGCIKHYIFEKGSEDQSELIEFSDPDKEYKGTVVLLHGHQIGRNKPGAWETLRLSASFLVTEGYKVLLPSLLGYGKTLGGSDYNGPHTIKRLIQTLKAWQGENDNDEKMSILGSSRGGSVAVLATLSEPEMFSCAVSAPGSYDLVYAYDQMEDRSHKKENIENEIGDIKKEDLIMRSPLHQAENITTPILIIHGENDEEIDVSEARAFDKRLTEMNKPHKLVVLQDKGHRLISKDLFKDHILDFLEAEK